MGKEKNRRREIERKIDNTGRQTTVLREREREREEIEREKSRGDSGERE